MQYTITEAARMVGVMDQTLKYWEKSGEFTSKRIGNRRVYTDSDIKKLKIIKARHDKLRQSGSYFKGKKGSGKK
jgi:DNA-binding transcriptional MerR regulator